jgi:hypothetical protein
MFKSLPRTKASASPLENALIPLCAILATVSLIDSKSFLNAVNILSLTLPSSNPTFLLSSVAPLSLFKISSTCFADIKAFASKVFKNSLNFLVVVSKPPLVDSSSFL